MESGRGWDEASCWTRRVGSGSFRIEDRLEIRQDGRFEGRGGNCSEAGPILACKEKCLIFQGAGPGGYDLSDIGERVRGVGTRRCIPHTASCMPRAEEGHTAPRNVWKEEKPLSVDQVPSCQKTIQMIQSVSFGYRTPAPNETGPSLTTVQTPRPRAMMWPWQSPDRQNAI